MSASIYLEMIEGTASKFWEVSWRGKTVSTRWGRIGTAGQTKDEVLATGDAAQQHALKLAASKEKKGYVRKTTTGATTRATPVATTAKPKAAVKRTKTSVAENDQGKKDDLTRLRQVFKKINQGDVIALCNAGPTQSGGFEDAWDVAHDRGGNQKTYSIIFWHKQSHLAFVKGELLSDLYLHWSGDRKKLGSLLTEHIDWLDIHVPPNERGAFMLSPRSKKKSDALDPKDTTAVWKFLEGIRKAFISDEEKEPGVRHGVMLRRIADEGEPKTVIYALQFLHDVMTPSDLEVVLAKIDSLASLKPGSQTWQDPSNAMGWILDAMARHKHPEYEATFRAWAKHKKKIYRLAAARHPSVFKDVLKTLMRDPDPSVSTCAGYSVQGTE